MKTKKKSAIIICIGVILILIAGMAAWFFQMNASSVVRLSANPQGNAANCMHHPSNAACSWQVSPFGAGPGAPGCASHATIPTTVDITDPTRMETPLATLQVWQSTMCHSVFASAYTSTFLGASSLSVSIASGRGWWRNALRETTLRNHGGDDIHAWTPLLYLDDPMPKMVKACMTVVAEKSYRVCTTVSL
jgi:hypothetical protein